MTSSEVQVEHLESETSHEYVLSVYFASLLMLLMIAIVVSNYVSHRLHLHWLPEAAATIGVDMVVSVILAVQSDSISTSLMDFNPNVFFVDLLPPIIFNSGYTVKRRYFFESIVPILTYSIFGTMTMSIVTGTLIYTVGRFGWTMKLSLAESLTFALAKSFPGEKQSEVIATTMIIILLSIFVMCCGTVSMLNLLQISRVTSEEEMALDKTVKPHKHTRLLQFDNKYLISLLTNLCQYNDSDHGSPDRPLCGKSFSASGENADNDEVIEVVRRDVNVH